MKALNMHTLDYYKSDLRSVFFFLFLAQVLVDSKYSKLDLNERKYTSHSVLILVLKFLTYKVVHCILNFDLPNVV